MAASNFKQLEAHVGHDIECVTYGDGDNVAVECITCSEVLLDYDRGYQHVPEACPSNHWNDGNDICADCGADLNA